MFKLLDTFGFSASLICAIHCMLTPLLISFGFIGYAHFLNNPLLEHIFIMFSLVIGLVSITPSYFKEHHIIWPIMFLIVGMLLVLCSRIIDEEKPLLEVILTVSGASIIALGHLANIYFLAKLKSTNRRKF